MPHSVRGRVWKFSPAASGWSTAQKICPLSQSWLASSESSDSLKSYHWVNPRFCQSCFIGGLLWKISWQWCNLSNTDNSAKASYAWNSAAQKDSPACCTDLLSSSETNSSSVCFIKENSVPARLWSRCINQGENRHRSQCCDDSLRQFKFIYSFIKPLHLSPLRKDEEY